MKGEGNVTPQFLPHCINVCDVNIIRNHDKELKAKALSLIKVWYIGDHGDAYGLCAKSSTFVNIM